jgi:hypothetical protein
VNVEDVLKIIGIVLFPSIGAVVWLLGQMYGLRSDIRGIQTELTQEREANASKIDRLERALEALSKATSELTLVIARSGISGSDHRTR